MISVCMTCLNGEKYIEKQIESILVNLEAGDELIISDDGSSDRTREIVNEMKARDSRIKIIEGPRVGIIANFENAIKRAKGDFIYLADQDDIWMPDKVKEVQKVFEENACDVVVHDAKVVNEAEEMVMKSFFQFRNAKKGVIHNIVKNSYIGCCMAFRRELIEIVLPIPREIAMHDQWIGVWGDLQEGSVFIKDKLILYRRHDCNNSQMTHSSFLEMIKKRSVFVYELIKRILWLKKK